MTVTTKDTKQQDGARRYSNDSSQQLRETIAEFTHLAERPDLPHSGPSPDMYRHAAALCKAELVRRSDQDDAAAHPSSPLPLGRGPSLPVGPTDGHPHEAQRPPPLQVPSELPFDRISAMEPEVLMKEVPLGSINPPVSSTVGFVAAPLRIPVPSGTIQALSLDTTANAEHLASRATRYELVEDTRSTATSPLIEINLDARLGDRNYLPAPIGTTVTEYCGEEPLSLPQAGEYGILVEGDDGYADAAYHISPSPLPRTIPLDALSAFAPSVEEMRYWQAALPLPAQLRQALIARLASNDPAIRDEVFDLICSYISSKDENGDAIFSYVCHRAVGELLEQQGEDLPFVLSELKIGHCDYLAWYTCALLRGYGVPAWITSEFFPTSNGAAFNAACGHARVVAWTYSAAAERLFDPTSSADLGVGWLPAVLPDSKVREWGALLAAATCQEEKRLILRNILEDVAQRAKSLEAREAAREFYGLLRGGPRAALARVDPENVSPTDLGVPTLHRAGHGGWDLLRKQEALATVQEIGRYFCESRGGPSITSTGEAIAGLIEGAGTTFERGLLRTWLQSLHTLRRPIFNQILTHRFVSAIDFSGPLPSSVVSQLKLALHHVEPEHTLFETDFVLRTRGRLTPNLQTNRHQSGKNELPASFLFVSRKNPLKVDLQKNRFEFYKDSSHPLSHLSREQVEKHLGHIDRTALGQLLIQHGFFEWTYQTNGRNLERCSIDPRSIDINDPGLVRELLTWQVDLQRALVSSHRSEVIALLDQYKLTYSDLKGWLAQNLSLDTSRSRRITPWTPPNVTLTNDFSAKLGALMLDASCQARVRGIFSNTVRSLMNSWAPQRVMEQGDLREYGVGDDARHIDWKTTGRGDSVLVKLAPTATNSPDTTLTVMIDIPSHHHEIRNILQINQIITECKAMVRRGRTVLLGSLQNEGYIQLTPHTVGISNAGLFAALAGSQSAGLRPGMRIAHPKHPSAFPKNLVLISATFERLLCMRELCHEVKGCKPIWLDAEELDVFPLPRPESW